MKLTSISIKIQEEKEYAVIIKKKIESIKKI